MRDEKGGYQSGNNENAEAEKNLPSWNDFRFWLRFEAQKESVTGSIGAKFHSVPGESFFLGPVVTLPREDNRLTGPHQDPSPASLKYGHPARIAFHRKIVLWDFR